MPFPRPADPPHKTAVQYGPCDQQDKSEKQRKRPRKTRGDQPGKSKVAGMTTSPIMAKGSPRHNDGQDRLAPQEPQGLDRAIECHGNPSGHRGLSYWRAMGSKELGYPHIIGHRMSHGRKAF